MNRAQIIARYALCEEEDDYDPKDLIMGEEFDLAKLICAYGRLKAYGQYSCGSLQNLMERGTGLCRKHVSFAFGAP